MLKAMKKLVGVGEAPQVETSGVRPITEDKVGKSEECIHVSDHETLPLRFVNESDMMLWLARKDPFLSHKDYMLEVQDHIIAHFLTVFTFNPVNGKVTAHIR